MLFYTGDWLKDTALRSCSIGARGMWIDMLCYMHDCKPYGHLKVGNKVILKSNLAAMVGLTINDTEAYLKELLDAGVCAKMPDGTIYSERMVRDEETRRKRAEGGHLGGNPNLKKRNRKPSGEDNAKVNLKGYPLLENDNVIENEDENTGVGGAGEEDGQRWQPPPFASEYTELPVEQCLEQYRTSGYEIARNTLAQLWQITPEKVLQWAQIFTTDMKSRSQPVKTMADYAQHFANWLKIKADKQHPEKYFEYATNGKNANAGTAGNKGADLDDLLGLRHNAQPRAGAEESAEQPQAARPA